MKKLSEEVLSVVSGGFEVRLMERQDANRELVIQVQLTPHEYDDGGFVFFEAVSLPSVPMV